MSLSRSYSGSYRGYTLRTEWEATQNINSNYSDLEIILYLVCDSGYNLYIGERTHVVTIDSSSYYINSSSISTSGSSTIRLGSFTKRIHHNSDGSCEVSMSSTADIRANIRGSYVGSFSGGSDTITLNKIPRMSTISDSMDGTRVLGTSHTIHIDKQLSGNITHDVWYVIRGENGSSQWHYIARKTSDLNLTFTPTDEHINLQPNSSTIFMDIGINTFKDGVQVGETAYSTGWYMKVPEDYSPRISSVDVEDINAKSRELGVYVQNHSKLKVSTYASGQVGATIKEIVVTVDKSSYRGSVVSTKEITSSGDVDIFIRVVDSRDKTAVKKVTIRVESYAPPTILNFSAERTKEDEKVVNLKYNFKMSNLADKNKTSWKIERRPLGSSTWTLVKSGNENNLNSSVLTYNVATEREYAFKLVITDFNSSNESTTYVYTIFVLIDFHSSGTGLAIGKSATRENFFDYNIKAGFTKGIEMSTTWTECVLYNTTKHYDSENTLKYIKDPFGFVHIQGIVTGTGTTGYIGQIRRESCRPLKDMLVCVPCTGYKQAFLRIKKGSGDILIENRSQIETNWISLDGITFFVGI